MSARHLPPASHETVGERFAAERVRLRLGVQEAADVCGITRHAIGNITNRGALPGARVLQQFALAGADVHYILTGARSEGLSADVDAVLDFVIDAPCKCFPATDRFLGHTCTRCRLLEKLRGKPTAGAEGDA